MRRLLGEAAFAAGSRGRRHSQTLGPSLVDCFQKKLSSLFCATPRLHTRAHAFFRHDRAPPRHVPRLGRQPASGRTGGRAGAAPAAAPAQGRRAGDSRQQQKGRGLAAARRRAWRRRGPCTRCQSSCTVHGRGRVGRRPAFFVARCPRAHALALDQIGCAAIGLVPSALLIRRRPAGRRPGRVQGRRG